MSGNNVFDPNNKTPGWSTVYANAALDDPSKITLEALRQLGYDPDRLGTFGEMLAQQLDPMIKAQAGFMGYMPGIGDEQGIVNTAELQPWAKQIAQAYVTPGGDANALMRQRAAGLVGNQRFQTDLGRQDDPTALDMIQNLALLRNAGGSGLAQSATQQRMREVRGLQDQMARQSYTGTLMDWLNSQPQDSDYRRRLQMLTGM